MRIAKTIEQVREFTDAARAAGQSVVLVPTMGALHRGHLSLIETGRARVAERGGTPFFVMSLFVNPTQFGPGEDFQEYPRDLDSDAALADAAGVDVLFAPSAREMYPAGFRTRVQVTELTDELCGARRPGHFDGVALVVAKLLNVVRPDYSVFGQKDAQQVIVIRQLVADLDLPGEVVVSPTVRDEDGLALSSRNAYLSAEERGAALSVSRGLFAAAAAYQEGERTADTLVDLVRAELQREPLVQVEYVELRERTSLGEWDGHGPALLAVAVRVGKTRLIDNVFLGGEDAPELPQQGLRRTRGNA
ncbi:MAG: pantothenate synthetase [Gemmatimonadota bacterium]|nr:MAG: pantothenate synthetase [Gemmatimonadota bacterium]